MGAITVVNSAKATVKVRHTCFPHLILNYFIKIIGDTMFDFSGLCRYNCNLRPSIKSVKLSIGAFKQMLQ